MIVTTLWLFLVLLLLGVPIVISLGIPSLLPSLMDEGFAGNALYIMRSLVGGIDSTPIIAIPLFMLSGDLMAKGGISKRLFDIFAVLIGKKTAGIPCAVIVTCLFYGAISGSGPATAAAVGSMCIPLMLELGYDKKFTAALVAAAGGLGVIIPPSIPFVVFGVSTGVSIGALFVAGVIPGILIALALMINAYIYCRRNGEDKSLIADNHNSLKKRGVFRVFRDGFWALLSPVIILGGIYGGVVTPTEAACVSVFYALFVSLFIYKSMKASDLITYMRNSVRSYAPIICLLAFAMGFSRIITLLKAPQMMSDFITSAINSPFVFLLSVNIILLIIGMFMDTGPAIAILAPLFIPAAVALGIDPVHFGIVMTVNLAIGFVTPPFGVNLFVVSPIVDIPAIAIGKKALPFIFFFILALLLITYIPSVSLFLGSII